MSAPTTKDRRTRRLLLATTGASLVCWYLPGAFIIAYPVRLFVTLIHEAGHGIATILTGGGVARIAIHTNGSGVTESIGGLAAVVYPAGYVGAAAAGAGLLLLARNHRGKTVLAVMAASLLVVGLMWIRNPFGLAATAVIAFALYAAARRLPIVAADFLAAFLAVQLCLNAVLDVRGLLWLTTNSDMPNDAVFMAQTFGLAPWFWAVLWSVATVAILALALRAYWAARP